MGKTLKSKDIWAMSAKDRDAKLEEMRNELMHHRGTAAMGGAMRSPGLVRSLRTSIARLLTIQTQSAKMDAAKLERKARQERAALAREGETTKVTAAPTATPRRSKGAPAGLRTGPRPKTAPRKEAKR
jgi:large subunit ribosomal protein L29